MLRAGRLKTCISPNLRFSTLPLQLFTTSTLEVDEKIEAQRYDLNFYIYKAKRDYRFLIIF